MVAARGNRVDVSNKLRWLGQHHHLSSNTGWPRPSESGEGSETNANLDHGFIDGDTATAACAPFYFGNSSSWIDITEHRHVHRVDYRSRYYNGFRPLLLRTSNKNGGGFTYQKQDCVHDNATLTPWLLRETQDYMTWVVSRAKRGKPRPGDQDSEWKGNLSVCLVRTRTIALGIDGIKIHILVGFQSQDSAFWTPTSNWQNSSGPCRMDAQLPAQQHIKGNLSKPPSN